MKKHIDIFDKVQGDGGYFGMLRHAGDEYFCAPVLPPNVDHRFDYHGKPTVSWSLNNYLGMANHPDLNEAGDTALRTYGVSAPMGSRMLTGTTAAHLSLEKELAEYVRKDSSYLFNYGYLGVLGTVCSLVGPGDTIVLDKLAHSCMVDAALLSQAQLRIFKHNNMADLEQTLRHINRGRKGGLLIAVEGVYGMTGDVANLKDICALAKKYDARVFVDDAHGFGVMGEGGRGSGEFLGVQDDIDLYFGTFAKAFAGIGGMTASTKDVRDWICFNARTQVFAKALPIVYVETVRATLRLMLGEAVAKKRENLWKVSNALKERLRDIGYTVGEGASPICSVFLPVHTDNPEENAMQFIKWLRENGIFVSGVIYPVIPKEMLMFRIVPTANHDQEDIDLTVEVFEKMPRVHKLKIELSSDEQQRLSRIYNP